MNLEQTQHHLRTMYLKDDLPRAHVDYLQKLKLDYNFTPKVIYDIGACVLHWTKEAQKVWTDSKIYVFEAMNATEFLYKELGYEYHTGVYSDTNDKEIVFYQSIVSPGGNSYYKEQSWATDIYYTKESEVLCKSITVDTAVETSNFMLPDLIKIDVQGCEIDVLKGMSNVLKTCKHLIVELQHSQYNTGAPLNTTSVPFIESLGYTLVTPLFCNNGPDGDYHFIKNE